jgi:hypothetical protein
MTQDEERKHLAGGRLRALPHEPNPLWMIF